jgi:hypothetical protein
MKAADICRRAAELVSGDRARTHGDKRRNHENIAVMWTAYLQIRRDPESRLTPSDVATMMGLVKVARMELGDYNPDDAVDHVGYAAIRGELDAK